MDKGIETILEYESTKGMLRECQYWQCRMFNFLKDFYPEVILWSGPLPSSSSPSTDLAMCLILVTNNTENAQTEGEEDKTDNPYSSGEGMFLGVGEGALPTEKCISSVVLKRKKNSRSRWRLEQTVYATK